MKNYLVIGHSSGIGKSLSEELGKIHRVFGTYNTHPDGPVGDNISSNKVDVMSAMDLSFLPEQLDGIAYCPGAINLKPFARITDDEFIHDYRLQVLGAVKVIQHCIPMLKKSSQGSILLFSSVAAQTGFNFHSLVSSSKGAIEGLVKALAAELAPAIRINGIAISITDTALAARLINSPEKLAANKSKHPLNAIGDPKDIARLGAFLLSDHARWITGQVITADGGISAIK